MWVYRTSLDAPRNFSGYSLWLQVLDDGQWYEVCALRASDARAVLRWLDRHPRRTNLRVVGLLSG